MINQGIGEIWKAEEITESIFILFMAAIGEMPNHLARKLLFKPLCFSEKKWARNEIC